jgi:hypothetical protein
MPGEGRRIDHNAGFSRYVAGTSLLCNRDHGSVGLESRWEDLEAGLKGRAPIVACVLTICSPIGVANA